jgi:23S rRNA pseudouridine2605 synthase
MKDKWNRPDLSYLMKAYPFLRNMHPVGRLDADTTGLLLFCREGLLTRILLDPLSGIKRMYEAIVLGDVDFSVLSKVLAGGVATTDGVFSAHLLEANPLCALQVTLS